MDALNYLNVDWTHSTTTINGKENGNRLIARSNATRVNEEPRIELIPRKNEIKK